MPGLTLSNEFISRDEALHTEFAVLIFKVNKKIKQKVMTDYLGFVEIEKEFICKFSYVV